MTTPTNERRATVSRKMAIPAGMGLCLLLAACGSGSSTASPSAASSAGSGDSHSRSGESAGGGSTGVSGQILAVSGTAMQVQGATGQLAVNWTPATTLAQILPGAESDLAVGKCVQVRQAPATTGSVPAAPADPTQPVDAGTVVISDAINGTCMRGMTGGGGRGGGGGGTAPGSGRARGGLRGTVASISGDTMTVTPIVRAGASAAPGADAPRTVALSPATVYSKIGPASSADLTVGKCVSAFGSPAGTVITADTVVVRPGNGSCAGSSAASGASSTPTTGADGTGTATSPPADNASATATPAPDSTGDSSGN